MKRLVSTSGKHRRALPPLGKTILKVSISLLLAVLLIFTLFTYIFSIVRYYGDGMTPTLKDRDLLVLVKTDNIKEGDIVAFYYNNKVLVRRVVCTEGKAVTLNESGKLYIDNSPKSEPYITDPSIGQCNITFPYTVPPDCFFVLGDNREIAMDSRLSEIGAISKDRIIGKVILHF